jgi:hypothetical protein
MNIAPVHPERKQPRKICARHSSFINYFVTSYNSLEKMRKPAISWNMHVSAERAHLSPAAQYGILYI